MSATKLSRPLGDVDIVLRVAIVALTLGTSYIHLTLGGVLFTLNAIGYFGGAVAMVFPLGIAVRYRLAHPNRAGRLCSDHHRGLGD